MVEDVNGHYSYDAGTVNEQFDNVLSTENSDGHLSLVLHGDERRVEEFAYVFGNSRPAPSGGDLSEGESMLFIDSADNGLKLAHATSDSAVNSLTTLLFESLSILGQG